MAGDASSKVPYLSAYGNISKVLEKIKTASVPDRFTQDFLSTKLGLSGGSVRPIIPYLKRAGFLAPDGSPSDIYKEFRNPSLSGAAAATAMRTAYGALYELNEYIHAADDKTLKGAVVQATGMEADSSSVRAMVSSFKALNAYADFEAEHVSNRPEDTEAPSVTNGLSQSAPAVHMPVPPQLRLGYTINLQLPNTTDVAVFNAIFKSLREHLL